MNHPTGPPTPDEQIGPLKRFMFWMLLVSALMFGADKCSPSHDSFPPLGQKETKVMVYATPVLPVELNLRL